MCFHHFIRGSLLQCSLTTEHMVLNIYGICIADGYDLEGLFLINNYLNMFFPPIKIIIVMRFQRILEVKMCSSHLPFSLLFSFLLPILSSPPFL